MRHMQNNQLMTTKPAELMDNPIVIKYEGCFMHVTKGREKYSLRPKMIVHVPILARLRPVDH